MAKEKDNNQNDDKKLQQVLDKLDKVFGVGTLVNMNDAPLKEYDIIPSGSLNLNLALGVGGYPRGRIVEIFGPESSGKTTLTLHAIAEAQKKGLRAAFIDVEQSFDKYYAESLGVNMSQLWFNQPDNGEQALEIVDALLQSEAFGIIIVDSVAALVTAKELAGEIGDSHIGLTARLMSQSMRKLVPVVQRSNTLLIFINQIRDKIGGMGYGPTTTTTGGHALKFAATQRLEVKRIGSDKVGDEITANKTRVKVVKNKVASPFKEAEFPIAFGIGIDKIEEILDIAVEHGIVRKAGSWFSYGDTKLGQGSNGVKELLNDNPELLEEIENKVLDLFKK